ncbi:MAG: N-6 DNA methylase [Deltaproteobacteria bacterium]|nr:N-6 DNA methylase [Deltaproteobacteria bacterium]
MQTQEPFYSARRLFPRGLEQPQGSLRFGADALLLAAFAARGVEGMNEARRKQLTAAELGCGCGAALLALALRCETVTGLGLEREAPLVQAATANALRLGLADRLHFAQADLADRALLAALPDLPGVNGCKAGSLDLVLANPPYGVEGRPSQSHMRERALRGTQGAHVAENRTQVLTVFCRAAAGLLRHQGYFFCIYDALALPHLSSALDASGFGLRGLLPVRTYASRPALRVLVLARKNAAHQCAIEAPLTLHVGKPRGGKKGTAQTESGQTATAQADTAQTTTVSPRWSAQALRFCPWLG